jgi:hypothetical protein
MSKAYFIKLLKPIREEGVSYFGRPRDVYNKIDRSSIACYVSRRGAENTILRLRTYKEKFGVYPSFDMLHNIDIDERDQEKLYRDRILLDHLHIEAMEYACALSGISLLVCGDDDGLLYSEHPFIEMGCDTYRDVLHNIISS